MPRSWEIPQGCATLKRMLDGEQPDGDRREVASSPQRLNHLRAAQLRARVARGGLLRLGLGTLFLIGALAHALSPQRHEQSSVVWITLLAMLSTINVGWGARALARVRNRGTRAWWPLAGVWGALAIVLLGLLLRR